MFVTISKNNNQTVRSQRALFFYYTIPDMKSHTLGWLVFGYVWPMSSHYSYYLHKRTTYKYCYTTRTNNVHFLLKMIKLYKTTYSFNMIVRRGTELRNRTQVGTKVIQRDMVEVPSSYFSSSQNNPIVFLSFYPRGSI